MIITREQVKKIVSQAKLPIVGEELNGLVAQLQEFMDYVDALKKMPSVKASPHRPSSNIANNSDWQGESCLSQEEVLALAPDSCQGMVRVPPVIEHG